MKKPLIHFKKSNKIYRERPNCISFSKLKKKLRLKKIRGST